MEKITHLSDDVTIMTSSSKKVVCMFRIKFPTKCTFRIFPILRTDGMAPFGTYLWNDPRMNKMLYRYNFHKVVRQQNSGAVEDFILPYSAVYLRIQK